MRLRKRPLNSCCVHLLSHKAEKRGMLYLEFGTRCVSAGEIHEILTTDQQWFETGGIVDRVGFLGFFEFKNGGVIERGDIVEVDGVAIGKVGGFDGCHYPNHYNIIVLSPEVLTANKLGLNVGSSLTFNGSPHDHLNAGSELVENGGVNDER